MNDLTITQKYMICAVNEKGKISGFNTEKMVCFVAAGLLEMQLENIISVKDKKVSVTGELPTEKKHLKPLYDYIHQSKPVKLEKILEEYNYSLTNKRLNELIESVGDTLDSMGLVETVEKRMFDDKKNYVPKKETIHGVIDMVRAELLEDGEITEDTAALIILLDKSKSLKNYFSNFEQKEIKNRLKEIVNSPNGKMVKTMIEYIENMIAIISVLAASSI